MEKTTLICIADVLREQVKAMQAVLKDKSADARVLLCQITQFNSGMLAALQATGLLDEDEIIEMTDEELKAFIESCGEESVEDLGDPAEEQEEAGSEKTEPEADAKQEDMERCAIVFEFSPDVTVVMTDEPHKSCGKCCK